MKFFQLDYQRIKQDGKESCQDNRNTNRAGVVAKYGQQARDEYEKKGCNSP